MKLPLYTVRHIGPRGHSLETFTTSEEAYDCLHTYLTTFGYKGPEDDIPAMRAWWDTHRQGTNTELSVETHDVMIDPLDLLEAKVRTFKTRPNLSHDAKAQMHHLTNYLESARNTIRQVPAFMVHRDS